MGIKFQLTILDYVIQVTLFEIKAAKLVSESEMMAQVLQAKLNESSDESLKDSNGEKLMGFRGESSTD